MTSAIKIELEEHRQHSRRGGNGSVERKMVKPRPPSSAHVAGQATNESE
jgi:hypothetical protein